MGAPYSVTVGTTARRIVDYSSTRTVVMIYNVSTSTVYLGVGKDLTTGNGFPLYPDQGIVLAKEFGDDPTLAYWAVVSSGTAELRIWEGIGKTTGELLGELVETLKK